MKLTLLQIVQKVLETMDSEDVNSISDSVEAMQVASFCQDVYDYFIIEKLVPEHKELTKLVALADNTTPTHMKYGDNIKEFDSVYYNHSEDAAKTDWREIHFVEPLEFLMRTDNQSSNYVLVADKNGGTNLSIGTDQHPTFYTSFDNEHIVMNSYKSTVDDTLQESKSRAYATKYPTFTISDDFTPDLDETLFPLYLNECKSTCMSLLKKEVPPKLEQQSRRLRAHTQGDRFKTKKGYRPHGFGR